jgi:putative PIN family toxin of toxin-antitoxin system
MRLVLDTNVVVAALLWSGPPRQLLQAARERQAELFTSTPLLAELTDVLGRPKFTAKIAASLLTVDELVDRYAALATVVRPASIPRVASDPDDDAVIATALAAQAQFVVTGDRSLLAVGEYQSVKIADTTAALVQITGAT